MSPTIHDIQPKMIATMATADPDAIAAVLTEHFAAFVSFQQHQASLPPAQNVNSAPLSLTSACHFGGNNAICVDVAVSTEAFTTYYGMTHKQEAPIHIAIQGNT